MDATGNRGTVAGIGVVHADGDAANILDFTGFFIGRDGHGTTVAWVRGRITEENARDSTETMRVKMPTGSSTRSVDG
jgi:hypothetical protein